MLLRMEAGKIRADLFALLQYIIHIETVSHSV